MPLWRLIVVVSLAGCPSLAEAATAEFSALFPNNVPAGTPVQFDVMVLVQAMGTFNLADVVIGSNYSANLSFSYSPAWLGSFANVSPPTFGIGFYDHDVFVGGNNPSPVGASLPLGTVTIDTTGMLPGSYAVSIDNGHDGLSLLGLNAQTEPLYGQGLYVIVPEPTTTALLVGALLLVRRNRFFKRLPRIRKHQ